MNLSLTVLAVLATCRAASASTTVTVFPASGYTADAYAPLKEILVLIFTPRNLSLLQSLLRVYTAAYSTYACTKNTPASAQTLV